jgi:SAM-dependent methyltransferase
MDLIRQERETYSQVWGIPNYGEHSPGEQFLPLFLDMAPGIKTSHAVLDAGCGAGKGALALRRAGFKDVTLCDLTPDGLCDDVRDLRFYEACLWKPLQPPFQRARYDWVYCCDVLEHLPPTFAMLAVHRLLEVAQRGVFLSICVTPDNFGVWVGKPLHQTVQSYVAWRDQLNALGHVVEARDLMHVGVYLVKAC